MAANSIAKLAVVITGDTTPLNQSMAQASVGIKQFAAHADKHNAVMYQLGSSLKVGVQGMHAFEGSTKGIIATLKNLATPQGAALAAAAAFVYLGVKIFEAADK